MHKAVILVVEHDPTASAEAVAALRQAGYKVVETASAAGGLSRLYETRPDLVIASTDLPQLNGENACARLRQASLLPLIIIGGAEEAAEMLELGADAYIIRPASVREVLARVSSLLKRRRNKGPGGRPERSPGGGLPDIPDDLSAIESRLATCLLFHSGHIMDYAELIYEVWGDQTVSLDTLHYHIRRLRQKLDDYWIFNVRGTGYGFTGA
jgi:two-component system response regulator ArlR